MHRIIIIFLSVSNILFLFAQTEPRIYTQQQENAYIFYVDSDFPTEIWLYITAKKLINFQASSMPLYEGLIQKNEIKKYLFQLKRQDNTKSASYQISSMFTIGNPLTAHHDNTYTYYFPFEHGTKFKLVQGYHGTFSHTGKNEYAVDFAMPEGTPICAARAGIVAMVKENSHIGGSSPSYAEQANYIHILHADGSSGNYVHLQYQGAVVQINDHVVSGQLIGYSGNTGFSSGPHLHFSVSLPKKNGSLQSIPFFFLRYDGQRISPEENKYYYGFQQGKKPFPVLYGSDLSIENFKDYRELIVEDGSIHVTTEQIDDTTIVYIHNGTKKTYSCTVFSKLSNMYSAVFLPVVHTVPPLSKIFITLLHPNQKKTPSSYRIYLSYKEIRS